MGDDYGLAHIRFRCAQIRLQLDDHSSVCLQTIADELIEAWQILTRLDRSEGKGAVGALFGQVLAMAGHLDEAVQVLEAAAAAWERIGRSGQAEQCRALAAQIKGNGK